MTDQNYFKSWNGKYPIRDFQEQMLHDINMFAKNMEHLEWKDETKREWMELFLKWMEWGTDMDEEYWGLTKKPKYDTFDSEPE